MNLKTIGALIIGLGLVLAQLNERRSQVSQQQSTVIPVTPEREFERWQLKPGSIYDGDTLRLTRDGEEIKVRFCGIDAPEKKQKLGIESRDYLRSLVSRGNGEILLVPIEQDRYGRTVGELYVQDKEKSAINLNLEMVRSGYAWHYARYSGNCPMRDQLVMAEGLAKQEKLGVWNGSHTPPWDYRKAQRAKK